MPTRPGRRIPEVWLSQKIDHGAAIETILYLLVPWVMDLPWSILYHVAIINLILGAHRNGTFTGSLFVQLLGWIVIYLVAFYPALITAWLCHRRDRGVRTIQCLMLGHSFILMN